MLAKSTRLAARTGGASASKRRRRSDSGAEAVEFALVLPVLLTLLFGIITMGTVFYHYEMLVSATAAGCRYISEARGAWPSPYTPPGPFENTVTAVENYATGLTSACQAALPAAPTNAACLTVAVSINGVSCSTDAACNTALSNNEGAPATVTATYPCTIFIMGVNLAPGCTLTQTLMEIVE